MNQDLLKLENVSYKYPGADWTLRNCTFSISPGGIKGIIGPNGAGKSTLLKIAACMAAPLSGSVLLKNRNMGKMSHRERARIVGYLPQHVSTHLDYTVGEVVSMGRFARLKGAGFMEKHDFDVVKQCMARTYTESLHDRTFSRLSGGERQRVLLASVLAQEPEVLLLDEPTSAMDMHHQVSFFDLLSELAKNGMAVGIVTHDLNLASVYSHSLTLMKDGAIVKEGEARNILTREILTRTYGPGMEVIIHPGIDRPMVLPSGPEQTRGGS